ncbi:MAG: radical SAM protein [Candidatus Omnitrophota bacterium]
MNSLKENDRYILNENYLLKFDQKRFELMPKCTNSLYQNYSDEDTPEDIFLSVHPMLALMLYLFDGIRSVQEIIETYSQIAGFNKEYIGTFVRNMIKELTMTQEGKYLKFGENLFYLPKNLLLKNRNPQYRRNLTINDFLIPKDNLDLESMRSFIPSDCIMEINFNCFTDCVYCYADRRKDIATMPIEKIKEIIKEAKDLRMRGIDLSGGEVFLYENWELLIRELLENDFTPYISTKVPLNETTIKKLKDLGLKGIQISLDSLQKEELKPILHVSDDYLPRMIKTIEALDREGIKIATNSQITTINEGMHRIKELFDFLVKLDNIKSIRFGAVGYSLYQTKNNFEKISISIEKILKIEELITEYKDKYPGISISFSGYTEESSVICDKKEKEKNFIGRVRCSGNFYAFVILPDGKVTICEQLYYHPRFIIGDLQKQTIKEIWNSEKALSLYNLSRESVREASACRTCEQFNPCHKNKGICWRNILIAYGHENWDFPDPACPESPMPFNRYWNK